MPLFVSCVNRNFDKIGFLYTHEQKKRSWVVTQPLARAYALASRSFALRSIVPMYSSHWAGVTIASAVRTNSAAAVALANLYALCALSHLPPAARIRAFKMCLTDARPMYVPSAVADVMNAPSRTNMHTTSPAGATTCDCLGAGATRPSLVLAIARATGAPIPALASALRTTCACAFAIACASAHSSCNSCASAFANASIVLAYCMSACAAACAACACMIACACACVGIVFFFAMVKLLPAPCASICVCAA